MIECSYADCDQEAKYSTSYVYEQIPLYGLRVCETHANELIEQHNDESQPMHLLELIELGRTHELLIETTEGKDR